MSDHVTHETSESNRPSGSDTGGVPVLDQVSDFSTGNMTRRAPCCGLPRWSMPLMMAVTLLSLFAAAYFAGQSRRDVTSADSLQLPMIDASAALSSEKFSMATGEVSEEADGLFVLDHNSGLLLCSVIYPRMGRFMAQFTVNVKEALGVGGKGGSYLMLTGRADFPSSSNQPAAATIVYVMDTATGNYAAYGIPFNRVTMNANRTQQAGMVLITTGSANPIIDRDTLR